MNSYLGQSNIIPSIRFVSYHLSTALYTSPIWCFRDDFPSQSLLTGVKQPRAKARQHKTPKEPDNEQKLNLISLKPGSGDFLSIHPSTKPMWVYSTDPGAPQKTRQVIRPVTEPCEVSSPEDSTFVVTPTHYTVHTQIHTYKQLSEQHFYYQCYLEVICWSRSTQLLYIEPE